MAWIRDRMLPATAVFCIAGLGAVLYLSGRAAPDTRLEHPWIFLIFTVALAIVTGLASRGRGIGVRLLPLVSVSLLFAVALGALVGTDTRGLGPELNPGQVARLESAREVMADLEPALARSADRISAEGVPDPDESVSGSGYFQLAKSWSDYWEQEFSGARELPLSVVLWRDGQRLAWTEGAQPLPFGPGHRESPVAADPPVVQLNRNKNGGLVRYVVNLEAGLVVEFQLHLEGQQIHERWSQVLLEILPTRNVPLRTGPDGDEVPHALLNDEFSGHSLRLAVSGWDHEGRPARVGQRWWFAASLLWILVAVGTGILLFGGVGLLAALWFGRALLALTGFFRLLGPAFPDLVFPARPGSAASLVDPAYFATPFFFGFFASTADAILTAALASYTVWFLSRALGIVDVRQGADRKSEDAGPTLAMALVVGLLAGTALPALQFFGGLVAENSNARLIGDGVSLSSLSFWVLHIVLMLAGLGLLTLTVWPLRKAGRPTKATLGQWVRGSLVVVAAAILVGAPLENTGWTLRLYVGGIAFVVYWIVPALSSRPLFLRRLAWPCLLLIAVCWNYVSLREVYSGAERAWLERKGQLITESAEDWMLFLLDDTLQGMQEAENDLDSRGPAAVEIWRDEAAYRLWDDSALEDLGYSCLVELIDAEGEEESLFATGQMRNFEYKVAGRSPWVDADGAPAPEEWERIFQTEQRDYFDGRESVLAGETLRRDGRGWIRVEIPVKSDRITTLEADLTGQTWSVPGTYRPRAEVDRPVLILRGDESGWRAAGSYGFPGSDADATIDGLRSGRLTWATIRMGDTRWLCRWENLPTEWALGPGDGFLLGLKKPGFQSFMLDLSRLALLNLVLFFFVLLGIQILRSVARIVVRSSVPANGEATGTAWRPGFQERFLAGYLLLGLVLLVVVGASVDQVGQDRIRQEARSQTRAGLSLAVQQLRSLLVEQARSLAASEYIADLLLGQLSGQRPAGPLERQQGMVFDAEGRLLLDETLSDLSPGEASNLLAAGREAPFVIIRDVDDYFVGTVIPIDLGDVWAAAVSGDSLLGDPGHGPVGTDGFFLYRQRFESGLLGGLAELARGQATLRVDGRPAFASHPAGVFSGREPLLTEPWIISELMDHPTSASVFAASGRPFAYTGCQPLPSFGRESTGRLTLRPQPAVLELAFPDREREFVGQRRATGLFLAGLANLILLTALVLALLLSWNIFRPLRLLLAATRSLARGDYEAPLPLAGTDEVGRLSGAFGLMRGELHSARDRLAAREQFLTTVLDRVPVGVAVLGDEGVVVTLNPTGRQILADFIIPGGHIDRVHSLLARFRESARGKESWAGELRSADGKRTLRGAIAPLVLPGDRTDTMLVFEDITEFLQTKMMAINAELARQVAHEIKNPLTPIQLSIQLLDQAWRDGHPQLEKIVHDTVSRVLEQVSLLRTIASEFSLLGRPGEMDLVSLHLKDVVSRAASAYGSAVAGDQGAGPEVSVQSGPSPVVLGNEESLQKILGNLMQNSLDAAQPGTVARIEVSWRVDAESVTLFWRDHGLGIPAEVADRLFDPYFSTKSSGTGLGLAICRNLADRMGGKIALGTPADGSGALVELTLPIAPIEQENE
jgi:signal transduction histidine kinase/HAMP domain-containing protein